MAGTKNRLQDYHTAKYARKSDAKITNKVQFPLSVFRSITNKECNYTLRNFNQVRSLAENKWF